MVVAVVVAVDVAVDGGGSVGAVVVYEITAQRLFTFAIHLLGAVTSCPRLVPFGNGTAWADSLANKHAILAATGSRFTRSNDAHNALATALAAPSALTRRPLRRTVGFMRQRSASS